MPMRHLPLSSCEEVARHRRAPDGDRLGQRRQSLRRLGRVEEIAVAIMFHGVAVGVLPVIEDLAADEMPADAPEVAPTALGEPGMAEILVVEIVDLERAVVEMDALGLG